MYFIICWICLRIVNANKITKYINKIGQNTGKSKIEKNVQKKAIKNALVKKNQNLNSGSRRIKGLNSSDCIVGSAGPSSDSSSNSGSNFGEIKPRNAFSWYIPSAYLLVVNYSYNIESVDCKSSRKVHNTHD